MRTTLSQQIQSTLMYVNLASSKLQDAQNHTTSGKRILRASDDVSGTNRSLSLRSSINTIDQYSDNIKVGKPTLQTTEQAINDLASSISSVKSIALGASTSTTSDEAMDVYATQLDAILKNMADTANTKSMDQYIFSGTATDTPAVVDQGNVVPPYLWQGNTGERRLQVLSWVTLPLNISGAKALNFDGSAGAGTTDVFTMVKDLRDAAKAHDRAAVGSQLGNIDSNYDNLLSCRAQVGSWIQRMDSAETSLSDSRARIEEMLSNIEDIDLPAAVVDLKTQENVYQAALMVSSKMLDLSLASIQRM